MARRRTKTLVSKRKGYQTPGIGFKVGKGISVNRRHKSGWFVVGRPAGKVRRGKKR